MISMTLHEAMHAFTSFWLGDDTAEREGRLTLNPVKHIDPFLTVLLPLTLALLGQPIIGAAKPVPFNPNRVRYGEIGAALVGVAGPITNFLLALAAAGILRLMGDGASEGLLAFMLIFIRVNLGFFVFNMIPFPPLDGSRLLYAFAPEPVQKVMAQIEGMGLTAIILFLFILLPIIGPVVSSINQSLLSLLLGL